MKRFSLVLFVLLLATLPGTAGAPSSNGETGMEKIKSLEGIWEGKDSEGSSVRVSYTIVSSGSSVLEAIDHHDSKQAMVTMYHLDGDKLMMTHYCSMGNQPRMRMTNSPESSVVFTFMDGTNMSNDDPHMHRLLIKWTDKDHITEEWTMRSEGKDSPPTVFKLERKS